MNIDSIIEIFTFLTGIAYIILEIKHKNFMWIVGVATAIAAMYMFFSQRLYASFALNFYYFCISFYGLYQWKKQKSVALEDPYGPVASSSNSVPVDKQIPLNKLTRKTIIRLCAFFVLGLIVLRAVLNLLHDNMSDLDAVVAVMSAVATYMLSKSYKEQWLVWIVADLATTVMCALSGMIWLTVLYGLYTWSAVYGYLYWGRHGVYMG